MDLAPGICLCPNCRSDNVSTTGNSFWCNDCGASIAVANLTPTQSSTTKSAHVRLSAVKVDIDNAFSAWQSREANTGNGSGFNESLRAESRVNAFLAQVEADRERIDELTYMLDRFKGAHDAHEKCINSLNEQIEADRKQLSDALAACRALDEANNDVDVRQATKLARIALAHPGP